MIARSERPWQVPAWQQALADAFRNPGELLEYLELDPKLLPGALSGAELFRMRVPRDYAALIRKGDPTDPLLLQVLPLGRESASTSGFVADPVGDQAAQQAPGLLHKYRGRVLLITSAACAIHCRYCFRRQFPYGDSMAGRDQWSGALEYLSANPGVREVILSGGDPLTLSDTRLAALAERLDAVPHLQRLRLHSRLPVVLPKRVDSRLLAWLGATRLRPILVVHANHPRELSAAVRDALLRLADSGVSLLNQSVLLKGVNDSPEVLAELSESLFEARVLPYYLHQLDRVEGTAHFEVSDKRAREIHRHLLGILPGYLVPRLVREVAGAESKLPLSTGPGI